MGMPHPRDLQRFRQRHKVGAPDQCWPWLGNKNGTNARFDVGGRRVSAQRFAYEIAHGVKVSPGDNVLKTCSTDMCVNPAHLKVASRSEAGRITASVPRGKAAKEAASRHRLGWIAEELHVPGVTHMHYECPQPGRWVNIREVYVGDDVVNPRPSQLIG